ncbi:carboxylesterase/lipase family protein [Pseudonocardia broussonetiae]|uniref:Carboxylic ester hydrolase n=1 Tax=Pseudonocardia broussonetiae TaxID=2736640 RepID=A0A6M6JRQ3_9PSEU|nr:carboxylesterase/lipase family protein [Pseudonocardia broussonetiae]QJY49089.1 carboxylesterase/lipase family protein [Pseudonocardia broussonetiae]
MHSVVKTSSGELRGRTADGVTAFLGVPYAAAPFGPRRFREPAPVTPWEGVRDALEHGPTAPAPGYPLPFSALLPVVRVPGEEILNVNVWTPDPTASGLPVMVWIHGGAFVNGSNSIPSYDGSAFARDGVVLVSVNYRLGAEGFLHLPDAPPNRGLLDQVAALRWVRDNIAAFGGDPDAVTVFGESAGGMSVGALLAMPSAAGLFHRAILQSGAGHHALSAATAAKVAGYMAEEVGVAPTVEGFAGVEPARLVAAQQALSAQSATTPDPARWREITLNSMVFEPVVDGEVLPVLPIEAVAAGASADVEVLVGSNRDEHRFFLVPTGAVDSVTDAAIAAVVGAYRLPAGAVEAYRAERPDTPDGLVLADLMSDWFFRIPAVRLAEAHGRAHVYEFDWTTPVLDGRLGSCHALEIGFVFDTLAAGSDLSGGAPPQALADAMHAAWVAFARTGDPGWPRYAEGRAVRRFGDVVETLTDPRGDLRELWAGVR